MGAGVGSWGERHLEGWSACTKGVSEEAVVHGLLLLVPGALVRCVSELYALSPEWPAALPFWVVCAGALSRVLWARLRHQASEEPGTGGKRCKGAEAPSHWGLQPT